MFVRFALSAFIALPLTLDVMAVDPPNIVLIMADDMGYSDIGCYGGEVRTPNLDKLAANGVRFTQFYNTGRCCPTRASLLTGLYSHQAGVGHMVNDRGLEGYRGRLSENCVTIAEVLRTAGYATAAAGKWHVTPFDYDTQEASHRPSWPLQRGFDLFRGSLAGGGDYYHPKGWMSQNSFIPPGKEFYYTDKVTDAAIEFIQQTRALHKPLFLYVAYTAPHWPLHALPGDIPKYEGVYDVGWDAIRAGRLKRMVDIGLIDPSWKLTARDRRVPAWEDAKHKAWEARRMAVYAAQIDRMDQGVGRIVAALERAGQADNTLVLFLADNGGCAEVTGKSGRFAMEGRDISRWGTRPDVMPGGPETFQSYGPPWANASNTPFREYKHYVHEGGIATPLIAHWPGGLDVSRHGALEHQPCHLIDLMATFVDLGGATYPKQVDGQAITPMRGVSLSAAFDGGKLDRSQPLFWEHEGNRAMRDGRWKLVARGARGAWELYDMKADRSEMRDLAGRHPNRVTRMSAQWEAWALEAQVKPWPWMPKKTRKGQKR
jgi:arylsulfatase